MRKVIDYRRPVGPLGGAVFEALDLLDVSGPLTADQIIERVPVTRRTVTLWASKGLIEHVGELAPVDNHSYSKLGAQVVYGISEHGSTMLERAMKSIDYKNLRFGE